MFNLPNNDHHTLTGSGWSSINDHTDLEVLFNNFSKYLILNLLCNMMSYFPSCFVRMQSNTHIHSILDWKLNLFDKLYEQLYEQSLYTFSPIHPCTLHAVDNVVGN